MEETTMRCIYRTNTKPVCMEIYLQQKETRDILRKELFLFRLRGHYRKGTAIPEAAEFSLPGAFVGELLNIAWESKNGSPYTAFESKEYTRRWAYADRIQDKLGEIHSLRTLLLSEESMERAYYRRVQDNRDRGAIYQKFQYLDSEDGEGDSKRARIFTIDYHPIRDDGELAQKPWVFSIRMLKKKCRKDLKCSGSQQNGHIWVAERAVELWLSEEQLQQAADAIQNA